METAKNEIQPLSGESVVPKTSGLAIVSLVWGLLGFVTVGIGGIFAIVLAHRALVEIKESAGMAKGRGIAIAGLITGCLIVVIMGGGTIGVVYSLKRTAKIANHEMIDMWGNGYLYRFPSQMDSSKPEIMSNGPDGVAGTADDLSSQDAP